MVDRGEAWVGTGRNVTANKFKSVSRISWKTADDDWVHF